MHGAGGLTATGLDKLLLGGKLAVVYMNSYGTVRFGGALFGEVHDVDPRKGRVAVVSIGIRCISRPIVR